MGLELDGLCPQPCPQPRPLSSLLATDSRRQNNTKTWVKEEVMLFIFGKLLVNNVTFLSNYQICDGTGTCMVLYCIFEVLLWDQSAVLLVADQCNKSVLFCFSVIIEFTFNENQLFTIILANNETPSGPHRPLISSPSAPHRPPIRGFLYAPLYILVREITYKG